jgi:[ribosomal protein S18]-alanine N-acetyltransferase
MGVPAATYRLRDYRPGDLRRLWEIDQQCFVRGIAYSQRELAHYIAHAGGFTVVAETAGTVGNETARQPRNIVGFLVGHVLPRGAGHIVTIDVLPEARRARIGSLLMEECEARMRAAECKAVYLETAVDNDIALRFYKRHRYSVLKTIPRYYLDSIDALLMGKKL